MDNDKKELCTIRIIFPVVSDEKAIEYKKHIAEVLKDIPDAQFDFRLSTVPNLPTR